MTRLLALDLGTNTGWAVSDQGRVDSGVQVFDLKRGESPGMRYLRFGRWLSEMAYFRGGRLPELLVYEAAHYRGGHATEVAVGLVTRAQAYCAEHGIEHASVHTSTLKKVTTGHARASKEDMVRCVGVRFAEHLHGRQPSDDEADALALLDYALAELIPRPT